MRYRSDYATIVKKPLREPHDFSSRRWTHPHFERRLLENCFDLAGSASLTETSSFSRRLVRFHLFSLTVFVVHMMPSQGDDDVHNTRPRERRGTARGEGRSTTDIPPLCGRASGVVCGRRPSAYAFFPSVVKLLRQRLCDFHSSTSFPFLLAFARIMQPLTH